MGDFTSDWFSTAIPGISRTLQGHNPKKILEIGSWEGRSAVWFLENFPESKIICVDTFKGSPEHHDAALDVAGIKGRFMNNTKRFGDRVVIREGHSSRVLFGLGPDSFDLAYVDGSHTELDTMTDLVMSFNLLKPGGIMLVDDFDQPAFPGVRAAVDKFATIYSSRIEVTHVAYQVHFVKKS
jgi:predicted O-methyltransferase YrrM